jgi:TonB family protein
MINRLPILLFAFILSILITSAVAQTTIAQDSILNVNSDTKLDTFDMQSVEVMPEIPGGTEALYKFLGSNIKYPRSATEQGIQGTVYVQFVINEQGKVSDATILRGVSPELDAESLRVINLMPAWKPGTVDGKPVCVKYTVPIKFSIDDKKKKRDKK